MPSDKELDSFLKKVDDLADVMTAMTSEDATQQSDAIGKADQLIAAANKKPRDNTGFSRTVINKYTTETTPPPGPQTENMDQESFMRVLEADAADRAARRKVAQKEADELRIQGNGYFKDGDYQRAYELYTEALTKIKDDVAIYTNRAQTLIKLGRFKEALSDCDWALRVNPECVKAIIHQGRAHLGMQDYDEARASYQRVLEIDPKKTSLVEDYIAEVDRSESASVSESAVQSKFEAGDAEITDIGVLLEKVTKPKELPVYYSGGFSVIAQLIHNDDQRTIFRTKGGLQLHSTHEVLNRCLEACPKSLSQEQLQMMTSAFHLFTVACTDNEKNHEEMFDSNTLPQNLMKFLESSIKGQGQSLKVNILALLEVISISHIGRTKIVTHLDIPRLLVYILANIKLKSVASKGMTILNNLALHSKFKSLLRDDFEKTVLPQFTQLLNDTSVLSMPVSPLCVTMVTNLSCDEVMRRKLGDSEALWDGIGRLMSQAKCHQNDALVQKITFSLMGLLINISKQSTLAFTEHAPSICVSCSDICQCESSSTETKDRSLQLVSNLLLHCQKCVTIVHERGMHLRLIQGLQDTDEAKALWCVKGLTACTQTNYDICSEIVTSKVYENLLSLLKSPNESIVGNSALCLSHCTGVPGFISHLAECDVIKDLLVLARDGKNEVMQRNCGILIAKLCQGDTRHLERLRELHGLEILHTSVKPYNL